MTNISFGYSQIKAPTPSNVLFLVRVFTVIAAVIMAAPEPPFITHQNMASINWCLTISIAISNSVLPLFGVKTIQKDVPIEDVTSMNEPNK